MSITVVKQGKTRDKDATVRRAKAANSEGKCKCSCDDQDPIGRTSNSNYQYDISFDLSFDLSSDMEPAAR
jgi:hypothetical protein